MPLRLLALLLATLFSTIGYPKDGNHGLSPMINVGICHPIENKEESKLSAVNSVSPLGAAYTYLTDVERRKIDDAAYFAAKMTLLQAPKHGKLLLDNDSGTYFSSNYSHEGPDSATVLVEVGGYKVKVIYHFVLMSDVPGSGEEGTATDDKSICPNGYMWKTSSTQISK